MPTWIDAVASRSGPLFTAATQFAAVHGLDCDPPRGVFGLQALSKLISGARHTTGAERPNNSINTGGGDDDDGDGGHGSDDEGERQFVAGAGAYLGLLLLDHLPNGAHVANGGEHRLRLSAHGFFDPFAAVADALNAHDAPRALLAAIKRAEAEADGPHGRRLRQWRLLFAKQIELMAFGKVLDAEDVPTVRAIPAAVSAEPATKLKPAAKGKGPEASGQDAAARETPVIDLLARIDTKVILSLAEKVGVFSLAGKRRGARAHQIYAGLSAADGEDLAGLGELGDWLEAA